MKRLTYRIIISLVSLFICFAMFCSVIVNAAEQQSKVVEETFTTTDPTQQYDFPETIEDDTGKYTLVDVQYTTLSEDAIMKEESITEKISEIGINKVDLPKSKVFNGESLQLIQTDFKPVKLTLNDDGLADIHHQITVTGEDIENQITIPFLDSVTGAEIEITLDYKDRRQTGTAEEARTASMTYYNVDAPYFVFEEQKVPNTGDKPPVNGFEKYYLAYLKLDSESFSITGADWIGDPYLNDTGELCRDGICYLIEYIPIYEITYGGENIRLPQVDGFETIGTYAGTKETETGEINYTLQATANYTLMASPTESEGDLSPAQIVLISVSVAAAIILAVLILYLISKKHKKKEK